MALKISSMTPVGSDGLQDLDMFEITQRTSMSTKSCTAEDIKNYIYTAMNGALRGTTTKDLNSFTGEDVGVWKWTGDGSSVGFPYTYGIVEIIRHEVESGTDTDYDIIQRVSVGSQCYQRMKTATNSATWTSFKEYGMDVTVQYGTVETDSDTGRATVTFPDRFVTTEDVTVICSVDNESDDWVFDYTIYSITSDKFEIRTFAKQIVDSRDWPSFSSSADSVSGVISDVSSYVSNLSNFLQSHEWHTEAARVHWIAICRNTVSGS